MIASTTGCFFTLDRDDDLAPGEVRGRAVVSGDPIAFARSNLVGDAVILSTTSEGKFLHKNVSAGSHTLRILQDDDNDSWPERAALVSFNLVEVAHAEGLFGTGTPRLSSINLGDVTLEGTVSLRGVVVDAEGAPAPGAKVIVARSISTVDLNGRPLLTSGSVEAQVATDDEGRFELAAIIPGTFSVVAMRTTEDGLRVSETKELTTNGATALTLLGEDALQLSAAAPAAREVVAKLSPPPAAGVNVILRVTPADRGLVQFEVVGDGGDYSDG